MLDHLFTTEERVWFHIGKDNVRSQKGTAKLGAVPAGECWGDPLATGQMQYFLSFVLSRDNWGRAKLKGPSRGPVG